MNNNKKSKKKLLIFIILTVGLLSLFGFLIYVISKNQLEIKVLKTDIYSEEQQIKNIDNLRRLVLSTADSRDNITKLFIDPDNTVEFLALLESLGRMSGVPVEIISVESEVSKKVVDKNKDNKENSKMKIRFKGTGSWSAVYKLTGLVSNLAYLVEINGMDLNFGDKGNGKKWEVVFEIIVDKI